MQLNNELIMKRTQNILLVFNLLIGILLIFSASVQTNFNIKLNQMELSDIIVNSAFTFFIFSGSLLIFITVLRFFGNRMSYGFIEVLHNLSLLFLLVIFAIFILVQFNLRGLLHRLNDDKKCIYDPTLHDYNQVYNIGRNLLCSPDCPCLPHYYSDVMQGNNSFAVDFKGTEASKLSECPNYLEKLIAPIESRSIQLKSYKKEIVDELEYLENIFDCSGFCSISTNFIFKNMSSGITNNEDCKEMMITFLLRTSKSNIRIAFTGFIYLFILSFFTYLISQHSQQQNEKPTPNVVPENQEIIQIEQKNEQNNIIDLNSQQSKQKQIEINSCNLLSEQQTSLSIFPPQQNSYLISSCLISKQIHRQHRQQSQQQLQQEQQQQLQDQPVHSYVTPYSVNQQTFNTQHLTTEQIHPIILEEMKPPNQIRMLDYQQTLEEKRMNNIYE